MMTFFVTMIYRINCNNASCLIHCNSHLVLTITETIRDLKFPILKFEFHSSWCKGMYAGLQNKTHNAVMKSSIKLGL